MDGDAQAILFRSGTFTTAEIREFSAAWAEMNARAGVRLAHLGAPEIDVTNPFGPYQSPRVPPDTPRPMVCAGCGAPLVLLTCSYCLRDNRISNH